MDLLSLLASKHFNGCHPLRGGNSSLFARIKFNITETFGTQFNEGN